MIAKVILSNNEVYIQNQYFKIASVTSIYEEAIFIVKKDYEMLVVKNSHLKNSNYEVAFGAPLKEIMYELCFAGNKKVKNYFFKPFLTSRLFKKY